MLMSVADDGSITRRLPYRRHQRPPDSPIRSLICVISAVNRVLCCAFQGADEGDEGGQARKPYPDVSYERRGGGRFVLQGLRRNTV